MNYELEESQFQHGRTLEVVFTGGKVWVYEEVPKKVYQELLESVSIGSSKRKYHRVLSIISRQTIRFPRSIREKNYDDPPSGRAKTSRWA